MRFARDDIDAMFSSVGFVDEFTGVFVPVFVAVVVVVVVGSEADATETGVDAPERRAAFWSFRRARASLRARFSSFR